MSAIDTNSFAADLDQLTDEELNKRFNEIKNELGLPAEKLLSQQTKKDILINRYQLAQNQFSKQPSDYLFDMVLYINEEDEEHLFESLQSFRIALTNNPTTWQNNSTDEIIQNLVPTFEFSVKKQNINIQHECLRCMSQILKFKSKIKIFMYRNVVDVIVLNLDNNAEKTMEESVKILIQIAETGHVKELESCFKKIAQKQSLPPFLQILNGLTKSPHLKIKLNCLKLINRLLDGIAEIDDRMKLRYEILQVNSLSNLVVNEEYLKREFDYFNTVKSRDIQELKSNFVRLQMESGHINACLQKLTNLTIDKDSCVDIVNYLINLKQDQLKKQNIERESTETTDIPGFPEVEVRKEAPQKEKTVKNKARVVCDLFLPETTNERPSSREVESQNKESTEKFVKNKTKFVYNLFLPEDQLTKQIIERESTGNNDKNKTKIVSDISVPETTDIPGFFEVEVRGEEATQKESIVKNKARVVCDLFLPESTDERRSSPEVESQNEELTEKFVKNKTKLVYNLFLPEATDERPSYPVDLQKEESIPEQIEQSVVEVKKTIMALPARKKA